MNKASFKFALNKLAGYWGKQGESLAAIMLLVSMVGMHFLWKQRQRIQSEYFY